MDKVIKPASISFFKKFSGFVHGFSPRYFETREGNKNDLRPGRSDDPNCIKEHRQWFLQTLGLDTDQVFLLKQVHGARVYVLDDPEKSAADVARVEADAIVSHLEGKPLGILTADCIPVVLFDPVRNIAGAIHAGRKGIEKRILSRTLEALREVYGCRVRDILLGMGPGIGGCCYEVDEPCIEPFRQAYPEWKRFVKISPGNKYWMDLFTANEQDAKDAGIPLKNIFRLGECTSCSNHRWYSYRREGETGRLMTIAMLGQKTDSKRGKI